MKKIFLFTAILFFLFGVATAQAQAVIDPATYEVKRDYSLNPDGVDFWNVEVEQTLPETTIPAKAAQTVPEKKNTFKMRDLGAALNKANLTIKEFEGKIALWQTRLDLMIAKRDVLKGRYDRAKTEAMKVANIKNVPGK